MSVTGYSRYMTEGDYEAEERGRDLREKFTRSLKPQPHLTEPERIAELERVAASVDVNVDDRARAKQLLDVIAEHAPEMVEVADSRWLVRCGCGETLTRCPGLIVEHISTERYAWRAHEAHVRQVARGAGVARV
ncbi:MAG: hypothetical protein KY469_10550 [Actinobacteria bacterium]|nr:hypothetical protein [Actinomycetota bacterium]